MQFDDPLRRIMDKRAFAGESKMRVFGEEEEEEEEE